MASLTDDQLGAFIIVLDRRTRTVFPKSGFFPTAAIHELLVALGMNTSETRIRTVVKRVRTSENH